LSGGFIFAIIIIFVAIYGVMYFSSVLAYHGSFSPAGAAAANQTSQNIQQIRQTATGLSIFTHNFEASIWVVIPIGFVGLFVVMWNTGQQIGRLAYSTGYSPLTYLESISVPVGLIEISAYTILAAESLYLTYLWFTGKDVKKRLLHNTWKSVILYVAVLLVAAYLEAALIA
ncbi:MAG TPA: stage II sporulation protein M, partial [Verrucomicrobiae bacterium]|nr:stage II sporulation protein M [Verrucomicrobiae bacterium]